MQSLTPRECEILAWFAQGKSAKDVASIVGISAATVAFHYRKVAVRYGTLNRTQTVVEAIRRGALIFPAPSPSELVHDSRPLPP